jgi:hypothetical protein
VLRVEISLGHRSWMRARGQDLDGAGARHLASVCANVEGRLYEAEHPPNGGHARRRGDQDGAAMTLLVPAVLPSSLVGGDSLFCSRSRAVQKRRERGRVVGIRVQRRKRAPSFVHLGTSCDHRFWIDGWRSSEQQHGPSRCMLFPRLRPTPRPGGRGTHLCKRGRGQRCVSR